MSWKTVMFSNPCKLSVKNFQLVCELKEEKITIPIEDIGTIILENPQISVTNYFLSLCSEYNVTIFTCDKKHKPIGVLTPFFQHSRNTKIAITQTKMKEPLKKQIWQKIIKQKIKNQSTVLKTLYNIDELDFYLKKVLSGDTKNVEATVSRKYWQYLFDNFKRHSESKHNSALDYGYAIIRGCLSKYVSASGLIPCLGIHHCNELNAFNLTEDLIEPFRPFVDLMVSGMESDGELNKDDKMYLISVLNQQCQYKTEQITIQTACERVCQTFVKAMLEKNIDKLELPEFIKGKLSIPME